jgi:hypothetical protein
MSKGDDQIWHANRTSQGENAGMHIKLLSWQHVFNGDKTRWMGGREECSVVADRACYSYYAWNERIYRVDGDTDTGLTIADVS